MQIIKYLDLFIGALINMFLYIYTIKKIYNLKLSNNKKSILFGIFVSTLFISIINVFNKNTFKLLLTFPFVVLCIHYVFSMDLRKTIIYVIISTLYMTIAEIVMSIILSILPFDYTFIFNNILGTTIGAILISIFTIILLLIKPLKKAVYKLTSNVSDKTDIFITILLIVLICAIAYRNMSGINNIMIIIMNFIVIITVITILYMYYKGNLKVQELSKNYNDLFKYLEKYEKELVEKRKIIHDYKNQLIIINGYIGDNEKLKEYINEVIDEQKSISENSLINNIDKLPRGLKGLIYYKLSHINKSIKINLEVLNSLKKFDNLPPKLNKDVLKIIGVLLDNAIEAVEHEKEKFINIIFSIKKNTFTMVMENTCSSNINYQRISEVGFSTKGKDRGYGMSLVNDILKHQKTINLNINVENKEFISELKVKI